MKVSPFSIYLSIVSTCLSLVYFIFDKNKFNFAIILQGRNTGISFTKKISNNISKHFSDILDLLRSPEIIWSKLLILRIRKPTQTLSKFTQYLNQD